MEIPARPRRTNRAMTEGNIMTQLEEKLNLKEESSSLESLTE